MPTAAERYDAAIALQEQGKLEDAVTQLEQLVQDEPGFALAHSALSVFYGRLNRFDIAVDHATRVCELEPNDPFSFVAKSLICQKAGKIGEAEEANMQARRLQMMG